MRYNLILLTALVSFRLLMAQSAEEDPIDKMVRLIESGEIPGVVRSFNRPEDAVEYLIDEYKAMSVKINNPSPELARRKARSAPEDYIPIFLNGWEQASDRADAEAHLAVLTGIYHETRARELRELLLPLLRGEVSRSFEPCEDCMDEELFLPYLAMELMRRMPTLARPEDVWLMLPYVEESNEYRVATTAIKAISKIADPSIIPALEEAVRRRTEKFPEDYTNIEGYLSYNLERITDKIRARYPNWSEDNRKGPGSPSPAEQDAAPSSEAEAEEAQEPPEASGSSESGEASKGSLALWTALVAGVLALAALAARRRAGKR